MSTPCACFESGWSCDMTALASTKADADATKMSGEAEPLEHGPDIARPYLNDSAIFHFECDEPLAEPLHRFYERGPDEG